MATALLTRDEGGRSRFRSAEIGGEMQRRIGDPSRPRVTGAWLLILLLGGGCFSHEAEKYWSQGPSGGHAADMSGEIFVRAAAGGGGRGAEDAATPSSTVGNSSAGRSGGSEITTSSGGAMGAGGAEEIAAQPTADAGAIGGKGGKADTGRGGADPWGTQATESHAGGSLESGTQAGGSPAGGASNQAGGSAHTGGSAETGGSGPALDRCPTDPNKADPGACGCGIPETPLCLAHRYSFNTTGTTIVDSIGTANGSAENCTQSGSGDIELSNDAYLDLPAGLLSSLSSATLEAWVTWHGGADWQRIFDFGGNVAWPLPGTSGGPSSVYVATKSSTKGTLLASFALTGSDNAIDIDGTEALPTEVMTHVALVLDGTAKSMTLFLNGAPQGSASLRNPLNRLADANNWLGRSQYTDDPYFSGTFHEFRIYSIPRSANQVRAAYEAGPDQLPGE